MERKRKRSRVQSLKSVSMRLFILMGIAVIGLLSFLILGLHENRRLADEYVRDTAELYVGQINRDIRQINSELVYIMEQNQDINQLDQRVQPRDAIKYQNLFRVMDQNRILKIRYSEVQNFYVYLKNGDTLITDKGIVFPESMKTELYEKLILLLEQQQENNQTTDWQLLHTSEECYIVSWFFREGRGMGCAINLNTVLDDLQNRVKNYQAIPFLKDARGEILISEHISEQMREEIICTENETNLYAYTLGDVGQIYLYIVPGSGMLERILNLQTLFTMLFLGLILLCGIVLYVYYGRILSPMQDFVDAIEFVDEDQMLHEDGTNNILELELASGKFRTLLRKIQSLKIAVYEKELQEQKAELEYMQEQIRPHFLLNCLSVIHGMADENGEGEIVRITEMLSDYMRYVMRDSKNQRRIEEELNHIGAYVAMQKLRYGEDAFSYEVILDTDIEGCVLPPLLLQTLVENSVVHGVSLDKKIDISLYITVETYEAEEYLYICVSDTGNGFSEEVLTALKKDTPIIYGGRKHVGLQNIQRRIDLMYGKRGSVDFSNMDENYGAVVEIRIPLRSCRKEGTEI